MYFIHRFQMYAVPAKIIIVNGLLRALPNSYRKIELSLQFRDSWILIKLYMNTRISMVYLLYMHIMRISCDIGLYAKSFLLLSAKSISYGKEIEDTTTQVEWSVYAVKTHRKKCTESKVKET